MRKLRLATTLCLALLFAICLASSGQAQLSDDIAKIGVMVDMNGPLSSASGPGQSKQPASQPRTSAGR